MKYKQDSRLLDDEQFSGVVKACLRDAVDYIDESVSPDRALATKYYLGKPFGSEKEGRSGYVSTDVRDTILGIMPPLMRIFTGVERVCEFAPVGPEDVQFAQQATDTVAYIFERNNGFKILHDCFKDALVRKTGVLKWWYESAQCTTTRHFTGQSPEQVQYLLGEDGTELVAKEEYPVPGAQPQVDPATGQEMPVPVMVEAWIRYSSTKNEYCVACLPPEEFLIDARARSIEDAEFVAHRTEKTVSELVAMGYDRETVEDNASSDDVYEYNEERLERNDEYGENEDGRSDSASKKVWYYECYLKYDDDDDGISSLLKVCVIGAACKVLAVENVDEIPFAILTPDPEPHTWLGLSEADKVMDIQRIKSDVSRGIMDSLAQSINPRTAYVQGQVNADDLLNNEVGALVRMRAPGMVQPLDTPFVGGQAFPMVEYLDAVREQRTGVSRAANGLNPAVMQSTTRAAVNATVEGAKGRVELLARVFAETGLKRLFKGLLKLICQHQDSPMMIRLRGQVVQVDPRYWNAGMDVELNLGMSASTTEEKMQILSNIAQKQEQIIQLMGPNNPLVNLAQYRSTLAKMVQLTGYKDASQFFSELPADFQLPPPPPQSDPAMQAQAQATQMMAEVEQQKAQMKMQIDAAKLQADQQVQGAKLELEREKLNADIARRQLELEMQAAKIEADMQIKQAQIVLSQLKGVKDGQDAKQEADEGQEREGQKEALLAQAISTLGQLIAQSQASTQAAMMMPKKVVRDANGRVAGVEPGEA